jgi:hypothetical protein
MSSQEHLKYNLQWSASLKERISLNLQSRVVAMCTTFFDSHNMTFNICRCPMILRRNSKELERTDLCNGELCFGDTDRYIKYYSDKLRLQRVNPLKTNGNYTYQPPLRISNAEFCIYGFCVIISVNRDHLFEQC